MIFFTSAKIDRRFHSAEDDSRPPSHGDTHVVQTMVGTLWRRPSVSLPSMQLSMSGRRDEELLLKREVKLRAIKVLSLRRVVAHMT